MDFKTSEYDYLNEATLQEWVSEFLSRNKSFISDCKNIIKSWLEIKEGRDDAPFNPHFVNKYKVSIPRINNFEELDDYLKAVKKKVFFQEAVSCYRVIDKYSNNAEKEYEELKLKFEDVMEKCDWEGWRFLKDVSIGLRTGSEVNVLEAILSGIVLSYPDEDGYYLCGDKLLLAINLNSSRENIDSEISKALSLHKKTVKLRTDKWKLYLIVFDLKENGNSYSDIASTLCKAFPDKSSLLDEKNIINYYQNAKKLINGEYMKYI